MPPLTVRADAKVPGKYWSKGGTVTRKHKGKKLTLTFPESNEGQMLVHKGELLSGILDKAVFGKFGLVHAVQVHEHPSFTPISKPLCRVYCSAAAAQTPANEIWNARLMSPRNEGT
jgi:hypothetical protein